MATKKSRATPMHVLQQAQADAEAYARQIFSTVEFKLGDRIDDAAPVILIQLMKAYAAGFVAGRAS